MDITHINLSFKKSTFSIFFMLLIFLLSLPVPTYAQITKEQKTLYKQGVYYFDINGDCAPTKSGSNLTAGAGSPNGAMFPNLNPISMADGINKYIEKTNPNSGLKNLGTTIVASAEKSNINPFLIIAVAQKESSLADPSDFNVRNGNNSFGRTATSSQPNFRGAMLWYKWSSIKASVDHTAPENNNASGGGDIASYIRNQYGDDVDKNDLSAIMIKYAPPHENDTLKYIAEIKSWVKEMVKLTNEAPTKPSISNTINGSTSNCECSPGTTQPTELASNIPKETLEAINKLKSAYEGASRATGVPWQAIAAIHYRESSNNPSGDLQAGNPIGGPYPYYSDSYEKYGYPSSMQESAEFAAKELIEKAKGGVVNKPINIPSPDPEALKDAFFGYNGRASIYAQQAAELGFDPKTQPYEGSPYVMNNFDDKHKNMKIITRDFGGLDGIDTRLGAYTLYVGLGGGSGQSCSRNGDVNSIVSTAMKYSWPEYHQGPYTKMKSAYQNAIQKAVANGEYVGGGRKGIPGIDCGGFITRVMRDSGADPDYNKYNGPTISQKKYMDDHPEKYEKLGILSDSSTLQPGDIAIHNSHTFMYIGEQKGFKYPTVSASISPQRSPMATNLYFSDSNGDYVWYRLRVN